MDTNTPMKSTFRVPVSLYICAESIEAAIAVAQAYASDAEAMARAIALGDGNTASYDVESQFVEFADVESHQAVIV